eukprot:g19734.t1
MTMASKIFFVLTTSSRLSGRRLMMPHILGSQPNPCSSNRVSMSTSSSLPAWPSPESFNALSQSSRTKVYCDYGEEGKMFWKPHNEPPKHPLPPFTAETALNKTKAAEAAWNTRDPAKVSAAYSPDTVWRNRDEMFAGRDEVEAFLTRK